MVDADPCPVCASCPCVLIAVAHSAMRRLILELLDRERGCWKASLLVGEFAGAVRDIDPDLVIVDGADFPRSCGDTRAGCSSSRVVVIGQEPDIAYRVAALRQGAGGWVARDDVADLLSAEMRRALGCSHGPRPRSAS